jgi:hypothetical protein
MLAEKSSIANCDPDQKFSWPLELDEATSLGFLGISLGGWIGYLIAGFIGACILIAVVRALTGGLQRT